MLLFTHPQMKKPISYIGINKKTVLDLVEKYKYLGVTLDCNYDTSTVVEELAMSGSRALGGIIFKTRSVHDLDYYSFSKLFNACVAPILDYASGAWSIGTECVKIYVIQLRAIRYYCGLPRNAPILAVICESGLVLSIVRQDVKNLRLYNAIVRMDPMRLTRKIFEYDAECNRVWYSNLCDICRHIDKYESMLNREPINIKRSQEVLLNMFHTTCYRGIKCKPKLAMYSKLSHNLCKPAPHLVVGLNKYKQALMSQVKSGCLPIEVELGRYTRTKCEERMCKCCYTEVECELHFLFRCPTLQQSCIDLYHKFPNY